jgi:hypothetical protein
MQRELLKNGGEPTANTYLNSATDLHDHISAPGEVRKDGEYGHNILRFIQLAALVHFK